MNRSLGLDWKHPSLEKRLLYRPHLVLVMKYVDIWGTVWQLLLQSGHWINQYTTMVPQAIGHGLIVDNSQILYL
jgi:hypothetical protein